MNVMNISRLTEELWSGNLTAISLFLYTNAAHSMSIRTGSRNIFIVVKQLLDMESEVKINKPPNGQMNSKHVAGGLQSFHNL